MTAPAARRESVVGEINTLLGRGSEFEGKLTFEGTVRIDGKLKGEVFSEDTLVIGEGAHVEAEIDIGEIIIQGSVTGNIRARRSIEIHAPGRVKGDLTTPELQIAKGVVFEGRSFMEGATEKMAGRGGHHAAPAAPAPGTLAAAAAAAAEKKPTPPK
jgi:cytoskeletal protein CcmA (bactofilin family)